MVPIVSMESHERALRLGEGDELPVVARWPMKASRPRFWIHGIRSSNVRSAEFSRLRLVETLLI